MEVQVSSLQAAATLEELIDRVNAGSDTVTIERGGRVVARLVPPSATPPQPGKLLTPEDIAAVARAVGQLDAAWSDAAEEAIRIGNRPMPAESPWDR